MRTFPLSCISLICPTKEPVGVEGSIPQLGLFFKRLHRNETGRASKGEMKVHEQNFPRTRQTETLQHRLWFGRATMKSQLPFVTALLLISSAAGATNADMTATPSFTQWTTGGWTLLRCEDTRIQLTLVAVSFSRKSWTESEREDVHFVG